MFAGSEKRKATNVSAIYFCGAFVVVFFCAMCYTASYADIKRVTRGVDDCGNICGAKNIDSGFSKCGPSDKSDNPFTKVEMYQNKLHPDDIFTRSECVKSCDDYPEFEQIGNRCLRKDKSNADFKNFIDFWPQILMSSVVAAIFSYILLILFRYVAKYVIWVIFITLLLALSIGCIVNLVFYLHDSSSNDPKKSDNAVAYLVFSIVLGILAAVEGIIFLCFRKRIRLVAALFQEASKVLIDLPLTIFEPILTFIALILTFIVSIFCLLVIESSGDLTPERDDLGSKLVYKPNVVTNMAWFFNIVAFIWFTSFIVACQNFVIASTVSQWFFTRSKDKLGSPMKRAFSHLIRFHIGSICLGAALMTLVRTIRNIINNMKNSRSPIAKMIGYFLSMIMVYFEQFMEYLVRNAYIIVALNGTPLIESGKKALRLISENLLDVVAFNKFGDFVLFVGKAFVASMSGFICYELIDDSVSTSSKVLPVIVSIVFAFLIVHCFMTVFEMTVDTIFICFCEDYELNDGTTRPFFMSRELMEVFQEMKSTAGGKFNYQTINSGSEAGQPNQIPAEWKFRYDKC